MKYTTLLMDADETIFDFPKCEQEALRATLLSCGLEFSEEINSTFSTINRRLWRELEMNNITRSQLRVERFCKLIEKCFYGFDSADVLADRYVQELSCQAVLIEGALEAVQVLSRDFEIYIITNGLTAVQRGRFARTELTGYIKKLYISDEMGVAKPSREFFDIVLGDIPEKDISKLLVVGDSLTSDMQGGRNAGIDTCLYDPHLRTEMPNELCTYRITDLLQIYDIAGE